MGSSHNTTNWRHKLLKATRPDLIKSRHMGVSVLFEAIEAGNYMQIKDIDAVILPAVVGSYRSKSGGTLLHYAAANTKKNKKEVVETLIGLGVDPHHKDKKYESADKIAQDRSDNDMAQIIRDAQKNHHQILADFATKNKTSALAQTPSE